MESKTHIDKLTSWKIVLRGTDINNIRLRQRYKETLHVNNIETDRLILLHSSIAFDHIPALKKGFIPLLV